VAGITLGCDIDHKAWRAERGGFDVGIDGILIQFEGWVDVETVLGLQVRIGNRIRISGTLSPAMIRKLNIF
jgi:hypothetical protein